MYQYVDSWNQVASRSAILNSTIPHKTKKTLDSGNHNKKAQDQYGLSYGPY